MYSNNVLKYICNFFFRAAFESGVTKPIAWRIKQLQRIVDMLNDHEAAIEKAVFADLRKVSIYFSLIKKMMLKLHC